MSTITVAQAARQAKIAARVKIELREEIANGWKPVIRECLDTAKTARLQREYEFLRRHAPTGNECHPQTKRYLELKAQLAKPIMKPEYRLESPDGNVLIVLGKMEFDALSA